MLNRLALPMALISLMSLPLMSLAQYRWTDAEGKVTYGDAPPPQAKDVQRLGEPIRQRVPNTAPNTAPDTDPTLPYELRRATERFPVTLYTTAQCAPCDQARNFLRSRGIPYTEKTISHTEEIELMKQKGLGTDLPAATIGRQNLSGFRADTWTLELNAAGYPEQSKLPPTWKPTTPQPLLDSPKKTAHAPQDGATPAPTPTPTPETDADQTPGQQTPNRPVRRPFRRVDIPQ